MDGITSVLQCVACSTEGVTREEEDEEVKGKFCLGNGISFECSRVWGCFLNQLFSIQNIVVCLCNVKPLLILSKSSHRVETAAWMDT